MTPRLESNRALWLAIYLIELERAITERPEEYAGTPLASARDTAERMTLRLTTGGANIQSIAIRRTCKALGVPFTVAGIKGYLNA